MNYFSDDEESEWPANIDPSLLDKANEEKQLGDIDFPRQFRSPSHTSVTLSLSINIREIRLHGHNNLACWIKDFLLHVLLCSIAENFYSFVF